MVWAPLKPCTRSFWLLLFRNLTQIRWETAYATLMPPPPPPLFRSQRMQTVPLLKRTSTALNLLRNPNVSFSFAR